MSSAAESTPAVQFVVSVVCPLRELRAVRPVEEFLPLGIGKTRRLGKLVVQQDGATTKELSPFKGIQNVERAWSADPDVKISTIVRASAKTTG